MSGIIDSIKIVIFDNYQRFADRVSEKYHIPKEELFELWRETQASYPRIRSPRGKDPFKKVMVSPRKGKVTGYILFGKEHRDRFKEKGLSFGEISREIGALWKSLDDEVKARYNRMATDYNEKKEDEKITPRKEDKKLVSYLSPRNEVPKIKIPKKELSSEEEPGCMSILRSGERKGQTCEMEVVEGTNYCKRHLPKEGSFTKETPAKERIPKQNSLTHQQLNFIHQRESVYYSDDLSAKRKVPAEI